MKGNSESPPKSGPAGQSTHDTFRDMRLSLGFNGRAGWPDRFGQLLRSWAQLTITRPIRVLSLFSGAGGLDIGFHDAGFSIENMIEIEPRYVATLEANCGEGRYFRQGTPVPADVTKYHPPRDLQVDFIIGGPPCQSFSAAGRRMAGVNGTADKRGALFEEYVRIVKQLSPRGFLFENVYGLAGAENGGAWKKIKRAFAKAGYEVLFRVIDAADFGVPQHRKRLFIVGVKDKSYRFPRPTHGPDSPGHHPYVTAEEAISSIALTLEEKCARVNGRYGPLLKDIPPGLNYAFYTEKMGHPKPVFAWRSKFYDFLYKADPKAPIRTLKAHGGHYTGPFHWKNRRFAVAELKRLQTIPDDYEIVGGREAATQQIGNAVPPQLARILALTILNQVFDVELPFELPLLEDNQSLAIAQHPHQSRVYEKELKTAIARSKQKHAAKRVRSREYTAFLSQDFDWSSSSRHEAAINVEFRPTRTEWFFELSPKLPGKRSGFSITVTPTPGMAWRLGTEKVLLIGSELSSSVFTGAWKAFERELIRNGIKADLVQLRGYYQYPPTFQSVLSLVPGRAVTDEWRVVQVVVSEAGVGEILSAKELARLWSVPKSRVLHYAAYLRSLGYEVRNSITNPQIQEGHFLIPYSFPTLNPLSVQLRKNLESIYHDEEKRHGTVKKAIHRS